MLLRSSRRRRFAGVSLLHTFTAADSNTAIPAADTGQATIVQTGTFGIASNRAANISGGAQETVAWNVPGVSDSTVSGLITVGATADCGLLFRGIDASNYLMVVLSLSGVGNLWKCDGGAFTSLSNPALTVSPNATHALSITTAGTLIRWSMDGTLVGSFTLVGGDATKFLTTTRYGLRTNSDAITRFDTLMVGV